jgi:hypothetical protein
MCIWFSHSSISRGGFRLSQGKAKPISLSRGSNVEDLLCYFLFFPSWGSLNRFYYCKHDKLYVEDFLLPQVQVIRSLYKAHVCLSRSLKSLCLDLIVDRSFLPWRHIYVLSSTERSQQLLRGFKRVILQTWEAFHWGFSFWLKCMSSILVLRPI